MAGDDKNKVNKVEDKANDKDYYKSLGFKCGIEIHRQLASHRKLFCNCANDKSLEFPYQVTRKLRAVAGELGIVDRAAQAETERKRTFVYDYNPETACMVEIDEEPPQPVNDEALSIGLVISSMLNMNIVDEFHVMRKLVVDGSAPGGFQRTGLLAFDGYVETSEGRVGIENLSIEEDSAPKVTEEGHVVEYRLDRLGVPLVEIGTAPDVVSPEHCKELAEKLGMILKSTGKVKRGLGTIRQDVNVSIAEGARVEIKGAQDLRMIPEIVMLEVERQKSLVAIRDELKKAGFAASSRTVLDVSSVFADSGSHIVAGKKIFGIVLPGLDGFFKRKLHEHRTLGNEVANYARVKAHVRGVIHTDEDAKKYGFVSEFSALRSLTGASASDLVVVCAADKAVSEKALGAVSDRVNMLISGVPEETRKALSNGDSEYMRPLPGASRMYPETDVPYVRIGAERVADVRAHLPETLEEKKVRFEKDIGLNRELAFQIVDSDYISVFEDCVGMGTDARVCANVFVNVLGDLKKRENVEIEKLNDDDFKAVFSLLNDGKITKDVIPVILRYVAFDGDSVSEVVAKHELLVMSEDEARGVIRGIIAKEKGAEMKKIIGACMGALKGKIENKRIMEIIKEEMK